MSEALSNYPVPAEGSLITLSEGGALATRPRNADFRTHTYRPAASKVKVCSGRYFARFTVVEGKDMYFGVIRLSWDVEDGQRAFDVGSHCSYSTGTGRRYFGAYDWKGVPQNSKAIASACCSTLTRAA